MQHTHLEIAVDDVQALCVGDTGGRKGCGQDQMPSGFSKSGSWE